MKPTIIKLLSIAAMFAVCTTTANAGENDKKDVTRLSELLPLFTAPNVPENGPYEDLDIGGPFEWMQKDKVTDPSWPALKTARSPWPRKDALLLIKMLRFSLRLSKTCGRSISTAALTPPA